jgi:outer membrane lipoprotein-sorting protein
MYIKKILIPLLISCSGLLSFGQEVPKEKQRALDALRALSGHYRNYKSLHFTISYKYSAESKPGVYLDSLKGYFTLSGLKYRYVMDSTEFIGDSDRVMVLYKQDRVMYLAKSSSSTQSGNPMALLDSLLLKNDSVGCQYSETTEKQQITLLFKPGKPAREITYTIDRKSGWMTRITQVVPSRQLYDPSVRAQVENNSSYAVVETDFMNYREGGAEESEPDLSRYFKKEGKQYIPLAPYDSYKIFLGTPDF